MSFRTAVSIIINIVVVVAVIVIILSEELAGVCRRCVVGVSSCILYTSANEAECSAWQEVWNEAALMSFLVINLAKYFKIYTGACTNFAACCVYVLRPSPNDNFVTELCGYCLMLMFCVS